MEKPTHKQQSGTRMRREPSPPHTRTAQHANFCVKYVPSGCHNRLVPACTA